MGIDFSVRFEDLRREGRGNVAGKITLRVSGDILGQDFDIPIDARNFNFPRGGDQQVYNQDFTAGVFTATVTATVHEHTAGQCCVQGHVDVAALGTDIGRDLDPNCQPIP